MGLVNCKKHDQQYGVLACWHIADAARYGIQREHRYITVDLTGDGTHLLEAAICLWCLRDHDLKGGEVLSDFGPAEQLACPVCLQALEASGREV